MNVQRLINETEDYIEQHLSEKITLEMLANHLNISQSTIIIICLLRIVMNHCISLSLALRWSDPQYT
jgi:hypothetical protein